jgi:hypothetical protein
MTCSPVARLKRMPRTKGFENRTTARSRLAYVRRNSRTSFWLASKLAKALASETNALGSTLRGALILKRGLTGGSNVLMNHRPTNPGVAGDRLDLPSLLARIAGSLMACRYTRFVVARCSRHCATLHEPVSACHPPCTSLRSVTSIPASRWTALNWSCRSSISDAAFTPHTMEYGGKGCQYLKVWKNGSHGT